MNSALTVWARRIVEAARLQPSMTLLDVGAGSCALSAEIAHLSGAKVIAVDWQEPQDVPTEVAFVKGSALDLRVPEQSVDAVLFSHLLHHVSSPQEAVGEATAALRPGGRLVVRTASHSDLRDSPQGRLMPRTLEPILAQTPDADAIADLLTRSGLAVLSNETVQTPFEGSMDDFVEACVQAARREWAAFPDGAADPAEPTEREIRQHYSEPPPVQETLILAERPHLPPEA